ncbi:uncharacterized protein LOC120122376 [Hibiscus syriacus]|uniref:uncharacterized protein LOC120122376 n=1 Tax=Hibiscus syriacus TaxID=106335 RepID=UPI001921924D|nr:uncharacterized protein LOC120122376 [Hibiscus syriacus]
MSRSLANLNPFALQVFMGAVRSRKNENCSLLDRIKSASPLPWLVGGDFNEILFANEKLGGRRRNASDMKNFREALRGCDLWDLKPSRGWFTWSTGHTVTNHIRERIDRFVASSPWLSMYQSFLVNESERKREKELRNVIRSLNTASISPTNFQSLWEAKKELKNIVDKEEMYWAQRSRVSCLKDGDRNTKFFHARASGRKKRNWVAGIENKHGIWVDQLEGIFNVAIDFFTTLFKSSNNEPDATILNVIDRCITPEMNAELCKEYIAEEVRRVLSQINPNKAPGIDGTFGSPHGTKDKGSIPQGLRKF